MSAGAEIDNRIHNRMRAVAAPWAAAAGSPQRSTWLTSWDAWVAWRWCFFDRARPPCGIARAASQVRSHRATAAVTLTTDVCTNPGKGAQALDTEGLGVQNRANPGVWHGVAVTPRAEYSSLSEFASGFLRVSGVSATMPTFDKPCLAESAALRSKTVNGSRPT